MKQLFIGYGSSMPLENTTPVPNEFFSHIPTLTHAELRVLLVVLRQTNGWIDTAGKRKVRDRLSYSFIIKRTGLYRTILSETIQGLINKQMLIVTDSQGNTLEQAHRRRGKSLLFYEARLVRSFDTTCSQMRTALVRSCEHNKRNTIQKKNLQKKANAENLERLKEMQAILAQQKRIAFD